MFAEDQGVRIYWDQQGQGEPVLLVMGLGCTSDLWFRVQPVFATKYRIVMFDNRGVGRSSVPPGPYSIALMAADAAAVLDAAGIISAHVVGVSMGGMIAQEFALQYPRRVRSLVLGCTSAGGAGAVHAEPQVIQTLMRRDMTAEQMLDATLPYIYDRATPQERIAEDLLVRRRSLPSTEGYVAQLQAIITWQAYSRLPEIAAPTLVVHGESDQLVPPGNGKLLAERIPGAKLAILSQASHMFITDQPEVTLKVMAEFLDAHSGQLYKKETASC